MPSSLYRHARGQSGYADLYDKTGHLLDRYPAAAGDGTPCERIMLAQALVENREQLEALARTEKTVAAIYGTGWSECREAMTAAQEAFRPVTAAADGTAPMPAVKARHARPARIRVPRTARESRWLHSVQGAGTTAGAGAALTALLWHGKRKAATALLAATAIAGSPAAAHTFADAPYTVHQSVVQAGAPAPAVTVTLVVITCTGGPCDWSASSSGAVTVHETSGHLDAGQSASIPVTVDGDGVIMIEPGDLAVQVTVTG